MKGYIGYIAIFIIGLIIRAIVFSFGIHFDGDVWTLQKWAVYLFEFGLSDFYYSDQLTDHSPGYMYVLWLMGAIRDTTGWYVLSQEFNMMSFTPPILSDLIASLFIYGICRRIFSEDGDFGKPFWFALAYSLNPSIIINSSAWGQTDAIHTLLMALALYSLYRKQGLPSYLLYSLAVLVKPHSLVVAPIFLFSAFHYFKQHRYAPKAALTMFGFAIITFAFMALLVLPFAQNFNLISLWEQYSEYLGIVPFASINAYNFHTMMGSNFHSINAFANFISLVAIIGVTLYSFWILHKRWDRVSIFFCAAMLYIITFNFAVQMRDRYLFPSILFLILAAIFMYKKNPVDKRVIILYAGFTITFFINCLDVLMTGHGFPLLTASPLPAGTWSPVHGTITLVSFISVALAIYSLKIGWDISKWTDLEK